MVMVTTSSALINWLPTCQASTFPLSVSCRMKVGTKAALIAPSANSSRIRFGIRYATL